MSNEDNTPTPTFYGNPLIGLLPADTADNLIFTSALLMKMDLSEGDDDSLMGLFRLLEAMRGAAHHLRLALPIAADDGEKLTPSVWIMLSDDEMTALDILSDRANQTPDEFAHDLIRQRLATAG